MTNYIELIVEYSGDVSAAVMAIGGRAEVLSPNFAIVTINEDDKAALSALKEVEYIEEPRPLSIMMQESLYLSCVTKVHLPLSMGGYALSGKGVITAFLDSGIDYTHPDFRNMDGTSRILYIWDMQKEGKPPEGFIHGTLYTKQDLDKALQSPNPFDVIPQVDNIGHGTAVAGVACGNGAASGGKEVGIAHQADIIAVKLGRGGDIYEARTIELMRGLKFISDMAKKHNAPCAVNISFGTNYGPHDGSSLFEGYIDEVAKFWGMSIVVAAGNEGSAGHHYMGAVKTGERAEVELMVSPANHSVYMLLWKDFADVFTLELISPSGFSTGPMTTTEAGRGVNLGNTKASIDIGQPTHYSQHQEVFIQLQGVNAPVTEGAWRLVIVSVNSVVGGFNIWLPTTEEVGRGTAFARPSPSFSMTIPATAAGVIAVGAYDAGSASIAEFSGRGDTVGTPRPDLAAPGVNVLAPRAGGGYELYSGTSIAAPFVTGSAALMMEWGMVNGHDGGLYGERLRAFLHLGASRATNIEYPNNQWGYGRLCLDKSFDYLTQALHSAQAEEMSLADYVQADNIIDILTKDSAALHEVLAALPFMRLGAVLDGGFAIVYIPQDKLDEVITALNDSRIRIMAKPMGLLGKEALVSSGIMEVQQRPYMDLKGRGVLLGLIDTGIDYKSPSFLYEDNTSKIAYIWEQGGAYIGQGDILMGREYSKADIDKALAENEPLPITDDVGHGTFISSVAGGRPLGDIVGAAPDSEIIMVKLRQMKEYYKEHYRIPKEQESAFSSWDFLLAIDYVVRKAEALGRPLSLCISLGSGIGSRDGVSPLEDYLNSIATRPGMAVTTAIGNEANAKRHTRGAVTSGGTSSFEINVGQAPSFTIYLWNRPQDSMYISVKSPTGEVVSSRASFRDNFLSQKLVLEQSTVHINQYFPITGGGNDLKEVIVDLPTPGIWLVNVYGSLILDGEYHVWMPMEGFISDNVEFITPDPYMTLLLPAAAIGPTTVGAYNHTNNSLYPPSSWGPTRFGFTAPELCAPGVNISGNFPTGAGVMSGTSVAAAITAGAAALLLQWGIVDKNHTNLNNLRLRSFLVQGASRDANITYPNNQWGFGRLNLMQTFEILKGQL